MPLDAGLRLGPYEVLGLLGVGGMGEVYKARDTRLDRIVAVKILPKHVADDPDRKKRFEREAKVVSQLSHPHVCAVYDIGNVNGVAFIVMEFVEGETLTERLARGALPVPEALTLFGQIAEALEVAHEKGTVHRDLKPANIKVTPEGTAKVLDFGLAKPLTNAEISDPSELPTASLDTQRGVVLGTQGYMSPEQARGNPVGRETDTWAFGCCLYEALAGKPAFSSETVSDTIAAVINRVPDWNALPKGTPLAVRSLLRRCLEKDAARRPQSGAEIRAEIERCRTRPPRMVEVARAVIGLRIWKPLAAVALLAVGLVVYLGRNRESDIPRFGNLIQVSSATGVEDYPTLSPDGITVAYDSIESSNRDIWVKQPGGGPAVNRTRDHAGEDRYPSWSPDGRQIAFWSERDGGGYYVMPALGGAVQKVASTPSRNSVFHSAPAWSSDGTELAYVIYEDKGDRSEMAIEIISMRTKETRHIPLPGPDEARLDLSWSADGRYFAYTQSGSQSGETAGLFVLNVRDQTHIPLTDGRALSRSPHWSPSGDYLYYVSNQGGTADLWRQRMSEGKPAGDRERVTTSADILQVAFSADGKRMAYSKGRWVANVWRVPIREDRPATWDDAEQLTFENAFIEYVDVSADGKQLAFSSDRSGNQDLWVMPLEGRNLTQLTFELAPDWSPGWSPDGSEIAFYSYRTNDRELWVMPSAGGAARQLTDSKGLDAHSEWSPDGRTIAFRSERTGNSKIWLVPAGGGAERQLTFTEDYECCPAWSPDGRWVAFSSLRAQGNQLWRVPAAGGKPELLSNSSTGFAKVWSRDGERIYFDGAGEKSGNLWALSIKDRRERPVTNLLGRRGNLGMLALASDGEYLYFTWRDDSGDIWTMDMVED